MLELNPDRLFPVDPETRALARDIYAQVAEREIISPHGHVDAKMLLNNEPFADATNLFLTYDHYVFRLLCANGVDLNELGVGSKAGSVDPRTAWRIFCTNWDIFAGTASGYWLTQELVTLFGITEEPSSANADVLFEQINSRLAQPDFRPQALMDRFKIDFLATTDDPLDDLSAHRALAQEKTFQGRVVPTWRPDVYVNARQPEKFIPAVERLTASVGGAADNLSAYLRALKESRQKFLAAGAVSTDHGVAHPYAVDLDDDELNALYQLAIKGELNAQQAADFEGAMLLRFAQMAVEDGLVMTVHPGVCRNHSSELFAQFGADTGHDIPVRTEYTQAIRPLLERYGLNPNFHLVLFTIDETVYSRELAPLAGVYPAVYVGAPWWFIDEPDAIGRWRASITGTLGFTRTSGFIDDTRAFLSIPARHDMARRCDAAFLARYVREGRVSRTAAEKIMVDLTVNLPRRVFKLDR